MVKQVTLKSTTPKSHSKQAVNSSGLVFNIQRFSLDDGPGIRTTVFLKGCPLSCKWCSNPESLRDFPEIMTFDMRCIGCHKCIEACPQKAITIVNDLRKIDWSRCNLCLECAKVCPSGAIEQVGRYFSTEELVSEVDKDRLFYQNSGGGVTFSGGEPLAQWKFVLEVCKRCQEKEIHTSLDTTGCAPWNIMSRVLDYVDLVLYDIKHLVPALHRQGTGIDNKLILRNLEKTASKVTTWLRIPVITGYNDSMSHIESIAKVAARLPVEKISLLPYHGWGQQKYERLGKSYPFDGTLPPAEEHIQVLKGVIESYGLKVSIGR